MARNIGNGGGIATGGLARRGAKTLENYLESAN